MNIILLIVNLQLYPYIEVVLAVIIQQLQVTVSNNSTRFASSKFPGPRPFFNPMPDFRCVEGCSRIFAADAHLLRHKKTCRFVQANRQKAQHIRREKGLSATALRDISSLTDRKQRLQVRIVALMTHLLISAIGITSISHWRPIFATKRNRCSNGC